MAAEQLDADRVEGAEPGHALDRAADENADALLHLARRLVGEGHRQDLRGIGEAEIENMGDAGGQNPGLAGARAGQNQNRALDGFDRIGLLGIEAREIDAAAAARRCGLRPWRARQFRRPRRWLRGRGVRDLRRRKTEYRHLVCSYPVNVVIRGGKTSVRGLVRTIGTVCFWRSGT
jgi:hypothetical protein